MAGRGAGVEGPQAGRWEELIPVRAGRRSGHEVGRTPGRFEELVTEAGPGPRDGEVMRTRGRTRGRQGGGQKPGWGWRNVVKRTLSGSEARQPLLHGSQLRNEGLCDGFPVLHSLCA